LGASTLEGVLHFKGHLVYTRDPSGSIFKAYSSTKLTVEAPEDKPSKDIGTGGSKALVEAATRAVLELNYPPYGAVDFH